MLLMIRHHEVSIVATPLPRKDQSHCQLTNPTHTPRCTQTKRGFTQESAQAHHARSRSEFAYIRKTVPCQPHTPPPQLSLPPRHSLSSSQSRHRLCWRCRERANHSIHLHRAEADRGTRRHRAEAAVTEVELLSPREIGVR